MLLLSPEDDLLAVPRVALTMWPITPAKAPRVRRSGSFVFVCGRAKLLLSPLIHVVVNKSAVATIVAWRFIGILKLATVHSCMKEETIADPSTINN